MLLLTSASDLITVITDASADIEPHASWVDNVTGTITPGRTNTTNITTATTTTVVAGPGSGQRNVKLLSLHNNHASTTCLVRVVHTDGTTTEEMIHASLLANESLVLDADGTWTHYDLNGAKYPAVGTFATQAEMEAASSLVKVVSPGNLKWHPGVAKAVMFTTGTATPVAQTPPTYNCTLTDTGVGQLTVNFTTAFSATTAYCVQHNVEVISTTLTAAANVMQSYMRFGGQASGGSCQLNCCDRTATTNVIRDPISWHVAAFGDQA